MKKIFFNVIALVAMTGMTSELAFAAIGSYTGRVTSISMGPHPDDKHAHIIKVELNTTKGLVPYMIPTESNHSYNVSSCATDTLELLKMAFVNSYQVTLSPLEASGNAKCEDFTVTIKK